MLFRLYRYKMTLVGEDNNLSLTQKMVSELPLGMQGPVLCVEVDSPMEKSAQFTTAGKA